MTTDEDINEAKQKILSKVIDSASNNEDIKSSGKEIGKTILTITKAVNTALLPLAAVNYGYEKARNYFTRNFEKEFTEVTKLIPPEHIVEPQISIAGPALQGLAFTHEEQDLKEMYLNLLAASIDNRRSNIVHPAYVEIIRQLSSDEANILKDILSTTIPQVPISQIRDMKSHREFSVLQPYVLNIIDKETGEPKCMPEIVNMIDNFIRLGLVTVDFKLQVGFPNMYDWVDSRPELDLILNMNKGNTINLQSVKGIIIITNFGRDFGRAVGICT